MSLRRPTGATVPGLCGLWFAEWHAAGMSEKEKDEGYEQEEN